MDLLYSVSRKQPASGSKSYDLESLYEGYGICNVSSQNVIAFVTNLEVDDIAGKTWGSHVYVADLNTPWNVHKITSNKALITAIDWDIPGSKLLIADASGNVQIWANKDHLLNEWTCLGTTTFHGENIVAAAFFHNGKKICLVAERKDNMHYYEKFSHQRFAASVRQFGGKPVEGCIVITSTGMVGVVGLNRGGHGGVTTATASLGSIRHRITTVDICFGKNGHFLIAASSGNVNLPILCYQVGVTKPDDKLVVTSQALPSFFPQSGKTPTPQRPNPPQAKFVTHLKFVVREDADSLVVASSTDQGSQIDIWELREKPVTIHAMFQQKLNLPIDSKTVVWQHHSQCQSTSSISCLTVSKISITTAVPPPSYVLVAFEDGKISCLYKDGLKQVATASINNMSWSQPKQPRLGICVSHMDITWLGNVAVAVDTQGQLYLYRLLPISEPGAPMTVPYACTLLEYCLVSGLDWWDLLVSLRTSMLEAVCDRFTESYNRQQQAVQQFHSAQFLSIKASLYRLSFNCQSKAADLNALMMLQSVATAFKSLLRPSDLSSHEKGPAESLAVVSDSQYDDVDKVLLLIEAKEFTMEPSTLQSLQQLIQWVADLALSLLARLPRGIKPSGYDILRDHKALNTLRELLVIIRIWGLLRKTCLPVFIQNHDSMDVLAHIFKLLSKLVQSLEQPDDSLIDECLQLPSHVMLPAFSSLAPCRVIASPAFFQQSFPLQLEYGTEPDVLQFSPELLNPECVNKSEQFVDTTRHIYLGKNPRVLKQCTRCGVQSQLHSRTRTAAIRAWDQRWVCGCRCGGHWTICQPES
ncbi:mediator of RNA polymerase II transcription subunit 16 [Thrips palmi]|uniref:Mediator of RNA polymerase II transcription subunit 16 n=1 Tax=Thrips palmi TaxID=161013 RepID=A0A6P9A3E7_THRPL|nr:mediator of RNA polymerase II transcription subunit 16 [Thrips palmi]XP_034251734.1 mediator of RNA polymerase II transcription subunit 16 [Thrips palmi]